MNGDIFSSYSIKVSILTDDRQQFDLEVGMLVNLRYYDDGSRNKEAKGKIVNLKENIVIIDCSSEHSSDVREIQYRNILEKRG